MLNGYKEMQDKYLFFFQIKEKKQNNYWETNSDHNWIQSNQTRTKHAKREQIKAVTGT